MQAVLNAALPIFGLIGTGYGCGRFGLFSREGTDNLNKFAIYLALPALVFLAMSRITPAEVRQAGFSLAFVGGIAVAFGAGFGISRLRGCGVADVSIEGLDAGYSNTGFMGIPLCLLAFGPEGLPPAVIATLFTGCVLFLSAIVIVEAALQADVSARATARKVLLSLIRNPLFLAPIAGLGAGLTGAVLPLPLVHFVELLGGAASPAALICIGLFLAQEPFALQDFRSVAVLVALKLALQPAATAVLMLYVFDVPPLWARAGILLSALPIGSGPFIIAKLYRLEAGVTSGAILVSHAVSILTVSALVAWLA